MDRYKIMIEVALEAYCGTAPAHLKAACRHALLGGGHRIRPVLTLAWCEACGGRAENALPLAVAVELVHTMSLIHDDLPCMDDAETRRGRPCLHKVYGEAAAVLAGDALLAEAFGMIARSRLTDKQIARAVRTLSGAAARMASGQAEEAAGTPQSIAAWRRIHAGKTAALLEAACRLGVIAANSGTVRECQAADYGRALGMAYQLLDDLRDGDGAYTLMGGDMVLQCARCYLEHCTVEGDTPAHRVLREIVKAVME